VCHDGRVCQWRETPLGTGAQRTGLVCSGVVAQRGCSAQLPGRVAPSREHRSLLRVLPLRRVKARGKNLRPAVAKRLPGSICNLAALPRSNCAFGQRGFQLDPRHSETGFEAVDQFVIIGRQDLVRGMFKHPRKL